MILNQLGQSYGFEPYGAALYIGQRVVANAGSAYAGLEGVITQIVSGEDMETENPGPDIYCDFELNASGNTAEAVSERLGCEADTLGLDSIIMSRDMLEPKMEFQLNPYAQQLYVLTCFVDAPKQHDDYLLYISDNVPALKVQMQMHIQENEYIKDKPDLWKREEESDDVYRLSFGDDYKEVYICYSIIPVRYEGGPSNAQ